MKASFSKSPHKHDDNDHEHDHGHGHSHGLFHSHAGHSHGSPEETESIVAALTGKKKDKGSRITLIGLGSNIALTGMKGVAGLWMNSASLLAEAGHSLSDMLGDFVTLACWNISRRPPSDTYPWGYSKFETVGTLTVSLILVGGAIGIGLHSYHLLLQVITPWIQSLDSAHPLANLLQYLPSSVPSPLLEMFHSHGPGGGHAHEHLGDLDSHSHAEAILNPHAAWFALISVVVKEWLYRATTKVATEEHSPVLHANALHHRSDALTSAVALASILGSAAGAPILDPLGGLVVSFFILQQGVSLSKTAFMELLDRGVDERTRRSIIRVVEGLVDGEKLLGVRNVRGVKSGGLTNMDLTITVPPHLTVLESHGIESEVRAAVMNKHKNAREVRIHVHADESSPTLKTTTIDDASAQSKENLRLRTQSSPTTQDPKGENVTVKSDFGRDGC